MNEKNKVLSKRVELAGNSIVAAVFGGATALVFGDITFHVENAVLATVLLLVGIILFAVTSWLLMELAAEDSDDTEDDDG